MTNSFDDQVAKSTEALNRMGLGKEGEEYLMIPPSSSQIGSIERTPAKPSSMVGLFGIIEIVGVLLAGLGALAAVIYWIYDAFIKGIDPDGWVLGQIALHLFFTVFVFAAIMIVALFVMGVFLAIGWIGYQFTKAGIRNKFVSVIRDDYESEPTQYFKRGHLGTSVSHFALDANKGLLFRYGNFTGWNVVAVPLAVVQRFDPIKDTETTVTTTSSAFGGISSRTSRVSEYSLRFHTREANGTVGQFVIGFGGQESKMQEWITALS